MKTCKDCIRFNICSKKVYKQARCLGKDKEVFITIKDRIACKDFKNKSNN